MFCSPALQQLAALRAQLAIERAKNAALTHKLAGQGGRLSGEMGLLEGADHSDSGDWAVSEGLRGQVAELTLQTSRLQLEMVRIRLEMSWQEGRWVGGYGRLTTWLVRS